MKSSKKVRVKLKSGSDRSYDILIGVSLLEIAKDLAAKYKGKRLFIITDSHVAYLYGAPLLRELANNKVHCEQIAFPARAER